MVTKQQLRNLARGRAILQARRQQAQRYTQRTPQRRVIRPLQRRIITIPRNAQLFGQFINPDIDVSQTDTFQNSSDISPVPDHQFPNTSTELNEVARDKAKFSSGGDTMANEKMFHSFNDIIGESLSELKRDRKWVRDSLRRGGAW